MPKMAVITFTIAMARRPTELHYKCACPPLTSENTLAHTQYVRRYAILRDACVKLSEAGSRVQHLWWHFQLWRHTGHVDGYASHTIAFFERGPVGM